MSSTLQEFATGVLNYSVIHALFLTIFVSLSVLHVGNAPYTSAVTTLDLDQSSYTAAAGDAAAFLSPQTGAYARWVFYVLECACVLAGSLVCLTGLSHALFLYNSLTLYIPNPMAKCEFLIKSLSRFVIVGQATMHAMFMMNNALLFILGRASAVAFLGAMCLEVLFFLTFLNVFVAGSSDIVRIQQHEARLILSREAAVTIPLGLADGEGEAAHPINEA